MIRAQDGKIQLGCVVGLCVFALMVLIGIKASPVMINVQEFRKAIESEAEKANRPGTTPAKVKRRIINRAEEIGIPLNPDAVIVKKSKSSITVHLEYDERIDFVFYTHEWRQVEDVDRVLF